MDFQGDTYKFFTFFFRYSNLLFARIEFGLWWGEVWLVQRPRILRSRGRVRLELEMNAVFAGSSAAFVEPEKGVARCRMR